jgi:cytochrome c oxidase assembly protein subunit 15
MSSHRHFHRLAWLAAAFAFCVIVFGAFVRLSDAGLSCPDWPTCYGHAAWPTQAHDIATANTQFARPVEIGKAWREQVHRMLAGTLGVLVLILALVAVRRQRNGIVEVASASIAVALSIPAYISGLFLPSALAAIVGELLLLKIAVRRTNEGPARLAALTLAAVVFQALLGQWTVTWKVMPIVVTGHLLGGLVTFALLSALAWRTTPDGRLTLAGAPRLRRLIWIGLGLLIAQIALGGWTSSNYAAWACGTDFPKCLGQWWPQMDFHQAFASWHGFGIDYSRERLDPTALTAIQMSHRIVAFLVFGHLTATAVRLLRTPGLRFWGGALLLLLLAQIALGIANVVFGLPLPVAVAHNAGAALLLFVLVSMLARLREPAAAAARA